jgi:hypothetical protein
MKKQNYYHGTHFNINTIKKQGLIGSLTSKRRTAKHFAKKRGYIITYNIPKKELKRIKKFYSCKKKRYWRNFYSKLSLPRTKTNSI